MHRLYKKPFGMSHDIALVKLSRPAEINRAVRLACLPDASVDLPIDDGSKTCWITGIFTINILGSNLWEFLFTATPVGNFGTIPFQCAIFIILVREMLFFIYSFGYTLFNFYQPQAGVPCLLEDLVPVNSCKLKYHQFPKSAVSKVIQGRSTTPCCAQVMMKVGQTRAKVTVEVHWYANMAVNGTWRVPQAGGTNVHSQGTLVCTPI